MESHGSFQERNDVLQFSFKRPTGCSVGGSRQVRRPLHIIVVSARVVGVWNRVIVVKVVTSGWILVML